MTDTMYTRENSNNYIAENLLLVECLALFCTFELSFLYAISTAYLKNDGQFK